MEDKRKAFTPLIEPDTPTPEPSPSPRGRSKGKAEASVSPPRKIIKDVKDISKKENKDSKIPANKRLPEKTSDDTVKSMKAAKKKDVKDADTNDTSTKKENVTNHEIIDTARLGLDDTNLQRSDSQTQMRAESSLSFQAPSIMSEYNYIPFNIEPAFGKIDPGKTQVFKIKFSPLNVNDYQARLTCMISNLEEAKIGPTIAIKGRGTLPYCHFDLQESDYLTSGKRDPERPGPGGAISGLGLDSMTKVVEFQSIGLFTNCDKKFDIINPTSIDYEFEWIREDQNMMQKMEMFSCMNKKGILKSGRRQEMFFTFFPTETGIHE